MKVNPASEYKKRGPAVVTIGTFDGVHVGHQKIIQQLRAIADTKGMKAVVLTFFPHPRMVLQKDHKIKLINTIDEKRMLLEGFGVDELVVKQFTWDFSRLTAVEYVRDLLVNTLNVKHIIIGYDHHFGRNRTANIDDLREFGEVYDFEVTEIPAQDIEEVTVSSTKIRQALSDGDVRRANRFLGYNFMLTGTIISGKGLGKTMDFPTANLHVAEDYKLIPKRGSYVIKTRIQSTTYYGMMNIGTNPTVEDKGWSIEMHLFDYEGSLYGEYVQVELLDRLRDERKFDSLDSLKQQLQRDKAQSLEIIRNTAND